MAMVRAEFPENERTSRKTTPSRAGMETPGLPRLGVAIVRFNAELELFVNSMSVESNCL